MKNGMSDLNNHLFMQLERLNDESIKGKSMDQEIAKAGAMAKIATVLSNNARLELEAQKLSKASDGNSPTKTPTLLGQSQVVLEAK